MAAIHRFLLPLALISLLLFSESLAAISSTDHGQNSNRRGDKGSDTSLAGKIISKRGVRSGVTAGRSTSSSSAQMSSSFFNVGSLICFNIAFVFAMFL
ncbi:hypothetical protein E5676_scaffold271G00480 [Cucumis melo var. makuwa]|uniref:Transmembrane protein n=1 Tax=Cucumis melo var. makuwa TaxID=1194695 RepID=A0A5D3BCG4_CUCMM|nr:hypothetical protein E6C27_scaffold57G001750 [Cucumis melo var. makuwa]TYJ95978.1 hypothetical protein E5676_scaffold271G00480 [Cucumis melo var. makuwa]